MQGARRFVAGAWRRGTVVPRVHSIDNPDAPKEATMTTLSAAARQALQQALQQAAALGLAACMTGAALVSLNHLATEQHAATTLAKAAAAQQQAQAAAAARRG